MRFSENERELIDRLIEARQQEVFRKTGQPMSISIADYIRALIIKDGQEHGFTDATGKPK